MNNKMTDDEWGKFLNAIPTDKLSPFGNYEEYLKREGVIENDVIWWNSLNSTEQDKIKSEEQEGRIYVISMYINNDNISPSEAAKKYYKQGVHYADYPYAVQIISELEKFGYTSEDDLPLPWELSQRISNHSSSIFKNPARFKKLQDMVSATTSGNAAIRLWIRSGVL
jgi:hypothetical protein